MGLDMYAYSIPKDTSRPAVDFDIKLIDENPTECENIHYWRKHPNLHGWMEDLYREKGGSDPDFNVNPLELTLDDLAELERVVLANDLPDTTGFFFGVTTGEERADDLAFIAKAREEIAKGKSIAYYAWW